MYVFMHVLCMYVGCMNVGIYQNISINIEDTEMEKKNTRMYLNSKLETLPGLFSKEGLIYLLIFT